MNEFSRFQFNKMVNSHLFNSQMEKLIIEYCQENDLILPDNFRRCHYEFFTRQEPHFYLQYSFVFLAKIKTQDDILREQIEFQIKQLEK